MNNKGITLTNMSTGETVTFATLKDAAQHFNVSVSKVASCRRVKNRTIHGQWTAWRPWASPADRIAEEVRRQQS
jgi:hypothetical protein